uniref:Proteasomal ATPase second OB domain-containing protein n=1 Tax=Cercocebus atys TaxID=9531 RepID=A0A2K5LTN4_CERAT
VADPRDKVLQDYRKKLLEHKEIDGHLNELREQLKELTKQYENVGQIVGEVLKQLTEEKFIVKATNGPRYVVGCRQQLDKTRGHSAGIALLQPKEQTMSGHHS